MTKFFFIFLTCFVCLFHANAQQGKKQKQQTAGQPDMNKMLEEAMKTEGMTKEEQEEMKKMMKDLLPALTEQNAKTADYPEFTSNKQLMPAKNPAKKAKLPATKLNTATISSYSAGLYNKILTNGSPAEKSLINQLLAKNIKPADIGKTAVVCMQQGHAEAAMALSMKAVIKDPANPIWQNNMASLLTQYGFPELAIPVLNKLVAELPGNSTIETNLAYAWMGLGYTDSVHRYIAMAAKSNPFNPDASLCGGLMDELAGDPVKATDSYRQSLSDGVSPFTESMLKNTGQSSTEIDFEKIRRTISIHEYFTADWMPKMPLLSSSVTGYAQDKAKIAGYDLMIKSMKKKISQLELYAEKELENLQAKGEDEFVKTMAKETLGGLNPLSKPAVLITGILSMYFKKLEEQSLDSVKKIDAKVRILRAEYDQAIAKLKGNDCARADAAANQFLGAVNPMIYRFYTQRAEKIRQWINAWITWNWFVAGNPKNSVIVQDIVFTDALIDSYSTIISEQITIPPSCKAVKDLAPDEIREPEVPDFTCPAVVMFPAGADWIDLTKSAADVSSSSVKISKTNQPVPNASISYTNGRRLGQAGIDPFGKTANGSMTMNNTTGHERISYNEKIQADHIRNIMLIESLPDYQEDRHRKNLEMIRQLPSYEEIMAAKGLFRKTMSGNCNTKSGPPPKKQLTFEVGEGKFQFVNQGTTGKEFLTSCIVDNNDLICIDNTDQTYSTDGETYFTFENLRFNKEVSPQSPEPVKKSIQRLREFKSGYDENGFVPTLGSSMQDPGLFEQLVNLFK